MLVLLRLISGFLSSQGASPQVLSAFAALTAVFGMGTGGSPQLSPLNLFQDSYPDNCIKMFFLTSFILNTFLKCCHILLNAAVCRLRHPSLRHLFPDSLTHSEARFGVSDSVSFMRRFRSFKTASLLKSSPRSISTGPLHTSLYFHFRPINHIVFVGPYLFSQ